MEYPFKDLQPLDEATERTGYYRDWTHIDANTFHQISELVKFIREKGYGADTREAIAQALERVYHDAMKSGNADMELSMARKHFKDLASRLDASDSNVRNLSDDLRNFSVDWINKNLGKLDQSFMSEEFLQQMAGNTPINAVPADGSLTTEKFADKSITTIKLSEQVIDFLDPTKFQYSVSEDYNKINQLSGINQGDLAFYTTGSSYTYEENNSFLNVDKMLQFNYESASGSIIRPAVTINSGNPKWGAWFRKSDLDTLETQELRFGLRIGATQYSGSFLNKEQLKRPGYTTTNMSNGIEIKTTVVTEYFGFVYVSAEVISSTVQLTGYTILIQTGTQPVSGKLDIINLTLVDTTNKILPYYVYPEDESEVPLSNNQLTDRVKLLESTDKSGEFGNIRGNLVGDSLAAPSEGYAMIIENYLGMENRFNRHAIGGRPMANGTANGDGANTYGKVWTTGTPIDYSQYALSLIMAGTNDFALDVPMGTLLPVGSSFDTNTFVGAYQDLIEHILGENPQNNVVLFTPLQRDINGKNTTSTNEAGHKLIEYVDAIIEIGALYGLPVYDAYRNSGVNLLTLDLYTYDGLHLNGQTIAPGPGYKFVGEKMAKFIESNAVVI